ncbi:hypothetical protein SAMD00019534_068000 [Acytostelium subglobosum LB1]|uniref:hypothetical protein n=1 Tax=Acytostelium subglobosum LB1 TaxID=1410327 RepID=UPI000644AD05|nr:hypothetical protein SAMD00019534_068000 [Acytostelium subglobosum LB1]GAM23625.1 hypothetical protein SAMD00019534_068000 [Acytostelium subglobosum LB1]|eukprot:XP_012753366.1 hypothetical protein SAMD00019534_068000 [Acytostelium subglobosum LB1]
MDNNNNNNSSSGGSSSNMQLDTSVMSNVSMMSSTTAESMLVAELHEQNSRRTNNLCEVDLRSFSDSFDIWREFNIASSSSSAMIPPHMNYQLPSRSGGFSYAHQSQQSQQSRIILWRVNNNQLELMEKHLHHTLEDNCIRINFHVNLVGDIGIFETDNKQHLVIMVLTTSKSLYRFLLPHPHVIENNDKVGTKRKGDPSVRKHRSIFKSLQVTELDNTWSRTRALIPDAFEVSSIKYHSPTQMALGTTNSGAWWIELSDLRQSGDMSARKTELREGGFLSFLGSKSNQRGDAVADIGTISIGADKSPLVFVLQKDSNMRVWSPVDRMCLQTFPIITESWSQFPIDSYTGIRRFKIYQRGNNQSSFVLVLYAELEQDSHFQFFTGSIENTLTSASSITMQLQRVVFVKAKGLVDFHLHYEHLYTLWPSKDYSFSMLKYIHISDLESDDLNMEFNRFHEGKMIPRLVKEKAASEEAIEHHYIERLFNRGQFTNRSIQSALSIYKPGYQVNSTPLETQVQSLLRDKIALTSNNKKTPVELLTFNEWNEFYSICIEQVSLDLQPVGLYIATESNLIFIIKRNKLSFMKPMTALEAICGHDSNNPQSNLMPPMRLISQSISEQLINDIDQLFKCFGLISECFKNDYSSLEHYLLKSTVNNALLTEIHNSVSSVMVQNEEGTVSLQVFSNNLANIFRTISNPREAIKFLLNRLSLGVDKTDTTADESGASSSSSARACSGDMYADIIVSSFASSVRLRYQLARSLALLLGFISRLRTYLRISIQQLQVYEQELVPLCHTLLKSYFTAYWYTNQVYYPSSTSLSSQHSPPSEVDMGKMHLSDSNSRDGHIPKTSIMHNLIMTNEKQFVGGNHLTFFDRIDRQLRQLYELIAPEGSVFPMATYLAERGQYKQLSIILTMVKENPSSSMAAFYYLMGMCFSHFGKYKEASEYLVKSSEFIANGNVDVDILSIVDLPDEELIPSIFFDRSQADEDVANRYLDVKHLSKYLLKCSKIFELRNQFEYVIHYSLLAVMCLTDSPEAKNNLEIRSKISSLYATIFKYSLKISQYEVAHFAIVANPDQEGASDCLNRLVVSLCENNKVALLCSLPFTGVYHDVEELLLLKAKSQDLTLAPDYYSILYTLHMSRNNYRRAAIVIYEKAQRVLIESHPSIRKGSFDIETLFKVKMDYLALAINALSLLPDDKNQWIPVDVSNFTERRSKRKLGSLSSPQQKQSSSSALTDSSSSPPIGSSSISGPMELSLNDSQLLMSSESNTAIKIVWLTDLRKEYIFYQSCHILRRFDSSISDHLSPKQLLVELLKHGLIETAFSLALINDIDLGIIFQAFAIKCVEFQLNPSVNPFANQCSLETTQFQFFNDNVRIAWKLLENYLQQYDTNENKECVTPSQLHKTFSSGSDSNNANTVKMYGVIVKESIKSLPDGGTMFRVSDTNQFFFDVIYNKRMPPFTKEGYPVIVEGAMQEDGTVFKAIRVLCKNGQSRYHELVVETILSFADNNERVDIPNWLRQWFKNGREEYLFKLYFRYGRIEEAVQILLDMLVATNNDVEQKQSMMSVNLPYNTIDQFLMEMDKILASGVLEEKAKQKLANYNRQIRSHLDKYFQRIK